MTSQNEQTATPSQLVTALQCEHPDWIVLTTEALGEVTAVVPREHIVEVCAFLKTSPEAGFNFLDQCADS